MELTAYKYTNKTNIHTKSLFIDKFTSLNKKETKNKIVEEENDFDSQNETDQ